MTHNIAARLESFFPPSIDEHDLNKKHATIGFDFAGIAGPCMALSMLGIPYTILCANESDESRRTMLRAHWQSRDGGDPAKANVTIGRFGHQLGNCVCANVMMRLWPQISKAGNLLKARAKIRDTWAELVAFCEEFSLTVPVCPEPKRDKVFTTCHGGQTPGTPWWPDPWQQGRAGDLVEAPSEEAEGVIVH